MVLAYSNSRLTRRPRELEDLIDLHAETGVLIKTVVSGDDDLSTADGRMVARIKANVDAAEAERTAERVARAHKQLALDGRHNGPRPFGWDFNDDRTLRINPAEAAVVRECVQRVLAGDGIWKITRDLNDRGIRTSTGQTWATQVLRRMLLRWRNCGVRTHRGKDVGVGQWEPIIDRATHERVVALLTDPARKSNNRGTEAKYLLTSVAYCGECGGHVVGTNEFSYKLKSGRTRLYPHSYKCPRAGCMKVQRRMADVDEHVTRVVLGVLERDGVRLLGGDPVAAESARERIAALEAKLALAADQFADDVITGEQLQRITARLRPDLDAERTRLRQAQPDQRPRRLRRAGRGRGVGAGRRRDEEADHPPAGDAHHDQPRWAGERARLRPRLGRHHLGRGLEPPESVARRRSPGVTGAGQAAGPKTRCAAGAPQVGDY